MLGFRIVSLPLLAMQQSPRPIEELQPGPPLSLMTTGASFGEFRARQRAWEVMSWPCQIDCGTWAGMGRTKKKRCLSSVRLRYPVDCLTSGWHSVGSVILNRYSSQKSVGAGPARQSLEQCRTIRRDVNKRDRSPCLTRFLSHPKSQPLSPGDCRVNK